LIVSDGSDVVLFWLSLVLLDIYWLQNVLV
jgi:hypothetical protein